MWGCLWGLAPQSSGIGEVVVGSSWLITTYFKESALNIRVMDQAHSLISQEVPGDPCSSPLATNEDAAERGRDLPEATQLVQG